MSTKSKRKRYVIDLSEETFDRMRSTVVASSMERFVDRLMATALDDPKVLDRLARKCRVTESNR